MMRLRFYALLAGAMLVALLVPGTAVGKPGCHHTVTPQGNSEAEQYSETLAGPCGNQPANPGGSGGSSSNSIPPSTLDQLQSHGAAGQNAAALAEANTPSGGSGQGSSGQHGASGTAGGVDGNSSGGGAVSGIRDAFGGDSGGGGMGLLLPLILVGTLVAGIAYWLMRRRAGPVS